MAPLPARQVMNFRAAIRELLIHGADDFVDAAEVAYIAKAFAGAETNDKVRAVSIELVQEMIKTGLMKVGDLKRDGFYPWDLSNEEIIERIQREWKKGDWPELGEIGWLAITERGRIRAKNV